MKHRPTLEATNAGHYFADCSCGWSGGVYDRRASARWAQRMHAEGKPVPPAVKPTILIYPDDGPGINVGDAYAAATAYKKAKEEA